MTMMARVGPMWRETTSGDPEWVFIRLSRGIIDEHGVYVERGGQAHRVYLSGGAEALCAWFDEQGAGDTP